MSELQNIRKEIEKEIEDYEKEEDKAQDKGFVRWSGYFNGCAETFKRVLVMLERLED